ncbi:MAG: amino acid permease [Actinomycetales bacterium]
MTAPPPALPVTVDVPEGIGYRLKRKLLGPPLTTDQIKHEKLSKRLALGVLSSDCISSSAYGSEEILLVLLPTFGLAAYGLLLPMTGIVLAVLVIVTLSYRSVVMVYTHAGGSYVVARENLGPVFAQVGAVALMIDYIVTVAVQAAAGTAAVTSAVPALVHYSLAITVGVVLVLFCGNLRGLREAGRTFAFPTYFFAVSMVFVIVGGLVREIVGDLPRYSTHVAGGVPVGTGHSILSAMAVFVLLRSFANGGSSLTGLEAISNGVSALTPPEGRNARHTLVVMSCILGTLVGGVSWLAHETHAVPYQSGSPTVISQVAKAVLGDSPVGHVAFLLVQLATMLILYTGANTPFNGFPFLANFVASDGYLPRWLTKRGHRLAFSNGIVVLTVVSILLVLVTGGHVNNLVAFYAIGVFTGFTLAGYGMARYFRAGRDRHWRLKVAVNVASGTISALVVAIFAITKFTEGAWVVLVLFPVMVLALLRLHRTYQREAETLAAVSSSALRPVRSRSTVLLLVDSVDLAVLRAVRYARSLRPPNLRAVHIVIDSGHAAALRTAWDAQPGLDVPLEMVDCPDRRLPRAAVELAARSVTNPGDEVTVLLPRRTYSAVVGRLLHDRTADDIAGAVGRVPGAAATILPYDVVRPAPPVVADVTGPMTKTVAAEPINGTAVREVLPLAAVRVSEHPDVVPIGEVAYRHRARVEGRVRSVRLSPIAGSPAVMAELCDSTGGVTLLFYGRRTIVGLEPGAALRAEGMLGQHNGHLAIANPTYELLPLDAPA